ncbi:MAG: YncE family protein [Phycisphaeraceae bacterium]|nr:MAG: YncE family protein [Phycisphaeraceae bacterium]
MRAVIMSLVLCSGSAVGLASECVHPDGDADFTTRVEVASKLQVPDLGHATRGSGAGAFVFTGSDPEGDAPSDVVFTPDGSTIVIAHRESGNLILWDAATRTFEGEAPVSGAAQALDITPDGQAAVVACVDTATVSIVDLNTLAETAVIPVGNAPGSVSISPDGARAAVHAAFDGTTYIINIATASVERTIPGIDTWSRLSFSFEAPAVNVQYGGPVFIDNTRLINIDLGNDEVQFINAATGAVHRLAVADAPFGLGMSADGTTAIVAHNYPSRTLTRVDLASETVTGTITATADLWGPVAVNADATRAVVGIQNAAQLIDLTTGLPIGFALDTASNNDLLPTYDGQYAVSIGFRGSVINFAAGTLVTNANNAVSCDVGAVSPVDYRAAMCSTTFGDDLVVVNTNGGGGAGLEAFQLSGPAPEGDRCRTAAISADGTVAVGVSIFSDTLSIIDTATGAVTGYAHLGERPSGVAITPDGTKAVVANLDSSFASVVDLATATTTNINISTRGSQVEISPDGVYAYIPVVASGDGVWRINLNTLSVEGFKLPTGNMGGVGYSYNQSSGIDLSADGSKLAVAGSFDNAVTIIDTASWTVERTIAVGDFPTYVAFSADGTRLFVANRNSNNVSVIDMSAPVPGVINTVNAGTSPWHLVHDLANNRLFVNMWGDTRVGVIDLSIPVLADNLPMTDKVTGLELRGGVLYAADGTAATTLGGQFGWTHSENGRLTMIDPATLDATGTLDLDYAPSALAMDAAGNTAVMPAPQGDGAVLVSFNGPCNPADLAEPYGVLDLDDISAFIVGFLAHDPAADLAPPAGVWDLADLQAFIIAFTGGCP